MKEWPRVGDVIRSEAFLLGFRDDDDVDESIVIWTGSRRKGMTADKSRTTTHFVVEEACDYLDVSADLSKYPGDDPPYPKGWHISARRLKADGQYDPRGEVIEFFVEGAQTSIRGYGVNPRKIVPPARIKLIGRMKRVVGFK